MYIHIYLFKVPLNDNFHDEAVAIHHDLHNN